MFLGIAPRGPNGRIAPIARTVAVGEDVAAAAVEVDAVDSDKDLLALVLDSAPALALDLTNAITTDIVEATERKTSR